MIIMTVKNLTKKTILAKNAINATTWREKSFGLILHKKPTTMIFQTRFGIHTFFMRYPIDVLILDNQHRVAAMKKNLKPNRIFLWNYQYEIVIELPQGTVERTKTKIGDVVSY